MDMAFFIYIFVLLSFVNLSIETKLPMKLLTSSKKIEYKYETKYFDTYLDHFSFVNYSSTFKLRYLISMSNWQPGNAILFYCGNEGSIDTFSNATGFMWELGEQLSAMVIFAEHRYYGTSLPFGDKSFSDPKYFGYLSSEQALADYASLITFIKGSVVGADKSAVIAFGGSYGGMLAAWFRQKYPNIVAGSLAASAPVLMVGNVSNCNNAFRVLTNAYRVKGSESCTKNIHSIWPVIMSMNSTTGLLNLSKIFHTCTPIKDAYATMAQLEDNLFSIGMGNYPYPTDFLGPMPAWPVTEFCKPLSTEITQPELLLKAFVQGLQVFYNYTGKASCFPLGQNPLGGLDANGWDLQTCTELPMPMCTDGITDMFYKQAFNRTDNDKSCLQSFKVKPRWNWGQISFWGNRLSSASNIIFSNGLLDPWSAGGVFSSTSDTVKIIIIPNGAHHLDLRGSNVNDPSDVRLARKIEKSIIQNWIFQWNEKVKVDELLQN